MAGLLLASFRGLSVISDIKRHVSSLAGLDMYIVIKMYDNGHSAAKRQARLGAGNFQRTPFKSSAGVLIIIRE